jgi:hypothetical protein
MTLAQRIPDELARLTDLLGGSPTPADAIARHTRTGSQNAATEVARMVCWAGHRCRRTGAIRAGMARRARGEGEGAGGEGNAMTNAAADLEEILPLLDAHPAGQWLATGVRKYLAAGGRLRLDVALGLTGPSGSTPWWRRRQLAERDALLYRMWQTHLAALDANAAAREIVGMCKAYESDAWRFDKYRSTPVLPDAYTDTPDAFLFRLMKLGAPIPARRQLANILTLETIKCI